MPLWFVKKVIRWLADSDLEAGLLRKVEQVHLVRLGSDASTLVAARARQSGQVNQRSMSAIGSSLT